MGNAAGSKHYVTETEKKLQWLKLRRNVLAMVMAEGREGNAW